MNILSIDYIVILINVSRENIYVWVFSETPLGISIYPKDMDYMLSARSTIAKYILFFNKGKAKNFSSKELQRQSCNFVFVLPRGCNSYLREAV